MPIVDNGALQTVAYILLAMLCAYGGGRIHQWYMHGMDRDRAFREGYSNGYHTLFPLAARGHRLALETDRRDGRDTLPFEPPVE